MQIARVLAMVIAILMRSSHLLFLQESKQSQHRYDNISLQAWSRYGCVCRWPRACHAGKKHNLRARMRARRQAGKERRHHRGERTREFFEKLGQSMRRGRSDAITSGQAGARYPRLRICAGAIMLLSAARPTSCRSLSSFDSRQADAHPLVCPEYGLFGHVIFCSCVHEPVMPSTLARLTGLWPV